MTSDAFLAFAISTPTLALIRLLTTLESAANYGDIYSDADA